MGCAHDERMGRLLGAGSPGRFGPREEGTEVLYRPMPAARPSQPPSRAPNAPGSRSGSIVSNDGGASCGDSGDNIEPVGPIELDPSLRPRVSIDDGVVEEAEDICWSLNNLSGVSIAVLISSGPSVSDDKEPPDRLGSAPAPSLPNGDSLGESDIDSAQPVPGDAEADADASESTGAEPFSSSRLGSAVVRSDSTVSWLAGIDTVAIEAASGDVYADGITQGIRSLVLGLIVVGIFVHDAAATAASLGGAWISAGVTSVGVAVTPMPDIGTPNDAETAAALAEAIGPDGIDIKGISSERAAFAWLADAASRAALRSRLSRLRSRESRLSCSDTRSYSHLRCSRVHV